MTNKSWKSFDLLLTTPSPARLKLNTSFYRGGPTVHSSSSRRTIAQLKTNTSPFDERRSTTLRTGQTYASASEYSQIEDVSSGDEKNETPIATSVTISASSLDCSALSLDPKDVTILGKSRADSDIEDISEPEAHTKDTPLEILETSSDDSDCEAIHCKRNKRLKLDFVNRKSPGCGRRITDDILMIENATERTINAEQSSTWIKSIIENNSPKSIKRTPKRSSIWKRLDESFKDIHPVDATKSPPNRKWKTLEDTFRENPPAEIEADLTPDNVPPSRTKETSIEQVSDTSFYDPTSLHQWPSRIKYRKDCPVSRFNQILQENSSMQAFWLHERQMNLLPAKAKPVQIETIARVFGRIAISYYEPDRNDPDSKIEHVLYVDPSEKQLKTLRKGSRIEVEYDLAPHQLSRSRIVHLGVSKIKAVD